MESCDFWTPSTVVANPWRHTASCDREWGHILCFRRLPGNISPHDQNFVENEDAVRNVWKEREPAEPCKMLGDIPRLFSKTYISIDRINRCGLENCFITSTIALPGSTTKISKGWPVRWHVTYHVHVAELKETAQVPPYQQNVS